MVLLIYVGESWADRKAHSFEGAGRLICKSTNESNGSETVITVLYIIIKACSASLVG